MNLTKKYFLLLVGLMALANAGYGSEYPKASKLRRVGSTNAVSAGAAAGAVDEGGGDLLRVILFQVLVQQQVPTVFFQEPRGFFPSMTDCMNMPETITPYT